MDLRSYFDQLDANTVAVFVASQQQEHLQLDFKTVSGSTLNGQDDKRNLAKAVSGFANSGGGIIVWGVDARKVGDVDCASGTKEISNIQQFVSRLNALTGEAASPIVDGIIHKAIPTTGTAGFAATLIPESPSGPHMAKLGEDRYYKRSGDSFYRMEHFDLEDMFGRRQKPRLRAMLEVKPAGRGDPDLEDLVIIIENSGRAVAKYTGLMMTLPAGTIIVHRFNPLTDISHINEGRLVLAYEDNSGVIHPTHRVHAGRVHIKRPNRDQTLRLEVVLYCEGMNSLTQQVDVPPPLSPQTVEGDARASPFPIVGA